MYGCLVVIVDIVVVVSSSCFIRRRFLFNLLFSTVAQCRIALLPLTLLGCARALSVYFFFSYNIFLLALLHPQFYIMANGVKRENCHNISIINQ